MEYGTLMHSAGLEVMCRSERQFCLCLRVCACARACMYVYARARVRACVCVCVYVLPTSPRCLHCPRIMLAQCCDR